jgi:hypothetical protein
VSKPKVETLDLYTSKDIAKIRALLTKEQNGLSAMTGLPLLKECLDHCHLPQNEQLVRGVLNSNENIALGKIENLYARYVGWWFKGTYPEFLRMVADYIDRGVDTRYRHLMWIKKVNTEFNKLSEGKKDVVLKGMGALTGSNSTERKKYFNACVMSRKFDYNTIVRLIKSAK